MIYKFKDLEFRNHPNWNGVQAILDFPNGYSASVVKARGSYGFEAGRYELAVMTSSGLVYDTPITDDVLGHLSKSDVAKTLNKIAALPERAA